MKLLTLAIALTDSKEPPAAFQIFALGETPTSKGTLLFDAEAATQVMAAFQAQGNELSIDYEHQSLTDPPVRAPAAAWFGLEVRADGLWAVNVRWTPDADAHLRAGEYRYFSPAVELDGDTGRVLRLINLALTNLPATKAMKPLVAAKDQPTPEPSMKTLLTAMGLKDTASEAEALSAFGQLTGRFQQSEQELLQLTSAASVNEAFGVIRGLKDSAAQLTKLNTRVQELEQQDREREVEALIGQGKRDGKLAPAQESFFREMGKKDVAILKGFLASAPKLVATAADAAKVPTTEADIVVLSETEKQTAKQLGVSEADFIASKKTQKAKKN
jgi:phage I-like protein